MNEFGDALKEARINARKKLRETAEHIGISIGYLSDIEQGRKNPPDLEKVRKLQNYLLVKDDTLVGLASEARTKRPTEIVRHIQRRPNLSALFLRAKNMSDEELEKLLEETSKWEDG
jgi:transcriptional regulator with XRE-family HTH domain